MYWDKSLFMVLGITDMKIPFLEVEIPDFEKTQFGDAKTAGIQDPEKYRHNLPSVRTFRWNRSAFIHHCKEAFQFIICINMCIIFWRMFCDSCWRDICSDTDIIKIAAENPHHTNA